MGLACTLSSCGRFANPWIAMLVLLFHWLAGSPAASVDVEVDPGGNIKNVPERRLMPQDVRGLEPFEQWENTTFQFNDGTEVPMATGKVKFEKTGKETHFTVLPQIMSRDDVKKVRKILKKLPFDNFDKDFDSVDAMPTEEFYVHEGDNDMSSDAGKEQGRQSSKQQAVRQRLARILRPVEEKITAFVKKHWPEQCDSSKAHRCRACHSLIRRYKKDERRSHMMHRDGHAIVTSVVSLSESDREYRGGLYVASESGGTRQSVRLNRGDVIVHQYDLLHGVQMEDGDGSFRDERWSWIMWFSDSVTCHGRGHLWDKSCAESGEPLCQYTYGWRMTLNPDLPEQERYEERFRWMSKAAEGGVPEAMFMVGRSHFGQNNYTGARSWFERAIEHGDPDSAYQMAHLFLSGQFEPSPSALKSAEEVLNQTGVSEDRQEGFGRVVIERAALKLFELAAIAGSSIYRGAPFAMYNLGVAWLHGYAGLQKDPNVAAQWFRQCGLPEGLMSLSFMFKSIGKADEAAKFEERAKQAGFGSRQMSRDQALFGLHSNWPRGPPLW